MRVMIAEGASALPPECGARMGRGGGQAWRVPAAGYGGADTLSVTDGPYTETKELIGGPLTGGDP